MTCAIIISYCKRLIFMVIMVAAFSLPDVSRAGESDFEWCRIRLSVMHMTSRKHLGSEWDDSPGFRAEIRTPFLGMQAGGGVEYMAFSGTRPSIPDASGLFTYFRFGGETRPFGRLALSGGLRMGLARMSFDKTGRNLPAELRTEREAAAGIDLGFSVPLSHSMRLFCSADWTTLFTVQRIEYVTVSAGLSHTFSMPEPLREFLK